MGADICNTNNMQELFTDVKAAMVVGPTSARPRDRLVLVLSLRTYREAKTVVISLDDYPLARRGEFWLKPNPGTTATLLNGMAKVIVDSGLGGSGSTVDGYQAWLNSLDQYSLDPFPQITGVDAGKISEAAILWATGWAESRATLQVIRPR